MKTQLLKTIFSVIFLLFLLPVFAGTQTIVFDPSPVSAPNGGTITFDINHTFDLANTTGNVNTLGFRLHYDSSAIAFSTYTILNSIPEGQLNQPLEDRVESGASVDADSNTDRYLIIGWIATSGDLTTLTPEAYNYGVSDGFGGLNSVIGTSTLISSGVFLYSTGATGTVGAITNLTTRQTIQAVFNDNTTLTSVSTGEQSISVPSPLALYQPEFTWISTTRSQTSLTAILNNVSAGRNYVGTTTTLAIQGPALAASATLSTLVAGVAPATADDSGTYTITLLDNNGDAASLSNLRIVGADSSAITTFGTLDTSTGEVAVTYQPQTATTHDIGFYVDSGQIGATQTFTVVPGAPSVAQSSTTLSNNNANLVPGDSVSITIIARDSQGNPITGAVISVEISASSATVSEISSGVYVVDVATSTTNGVVTVTTTINGTTFVNTITFGSVPTFVLNETPINLIENTSNTLRHTIPISASDTDGGISTFAITTAGNIFTTNPAPVVSFSATAIDTNSTLSGASTDANLYFSIIPDTTGDGTLTITLTDPDGNADSVELTVSIAPATNTPVITNPFDSRLSNINVYGGSLYGLTGQDSYDNLVNSFNSDGGFLVRLDTKNEEDNIFSAITANGFWSGVDDITNDSTWTYVNNGEILGIDPTPAAGNGGGFDVYPGFYENFNGSINGREPNNFATNQDCLEIVNASMWADTNCDTTTVQAVFEFPDGFATVNTTAGNTLIENNGSGQIATLSGFDLDGSTLTWSGVASDGGTVTFGNTTTSSATGTTSVLYEPNASSNTPQTVTVTLADATGATDTVVISVQIDLRANAVDSSLTLSSADITAGNSTTVTATLRDSDGSLTDVASNTLSFSTSGDATMGAITRQNVGIYTVSISDDTAEVVTVTATVNSVDISSFVSSNTLNFVADSISLANSSLILSTNNAIAGVTFSATVIVRDQFNNNITNTTPVLMVGGSANASIAETVVDNGITVYTFNASDTVKESIMVTATIGVANLTASVVVNSAPIASVNLSLNNSTVVANSSTVVLSATVVDEFGNTVSDSGTLDLTVGNIVGNTSINLTNVSPSFTAGVISGVDITSTDANGGSVTITASVMGTPSASGAVVLVVQAFGFDQTQINMIAGDSIILSPRNGNANTTWAIVTGTGIISSTTGASITYTSTLTAGATNSISKVLATSEDNTVSTITINTYNPIVITVFDTLVRLTSTTLAIAGGNESYVFTSLDSGIISVDASGIITANSVIGSTTSITVVDTLVYSISSGTKTNADSVLITVLKGADLPAVGAQSTVTYNSATSVLLINSSTIDGSYTITLNDEFGVSTADGTITLISSRDGSLAFTSDSTDSVRVITASLTSGSYTIGVYVNGNMIAGSSQTILITSPPVFTLAQTSVSLVENASNTLRYSINVTGITDVGLESNTFSVTTAGTIFTSNPAPIVSFATNSINSSQALNASASNATLYFSIIPDATGNGTLIITLTDTNNEAVSRTISVSVTPASNIPVISQDITTFVNNAIANTVTNIYAYADDVSVFGGKLYFGVEPSPNGNEGADFSDFVALQSAFSSNGQSVNNRLGAHIAIIDSEQERLFINTLIGGSFDAFLGLASEDESGFGNSGDNTTWFSVLGDFIFESLNTSGNNAFAPGRYSFAINDDSDSQDCLRYQEDGAFNDRDCNDRGLFIDDSFFELPLGLPSTTTISGNTIIQGTTSTIATLSGYDLDGDNISWTSSSSANGVVTFSSQNPSSSAGTTDVMFTPNINFTGTETITVSLSANSQTVNAAINFIITPDSSALVRGSTITVSGNTALTADESAESVITVLDNFGGASTATITTDSNNVAVVSSADNSAATLTYTATTAGTETVVIYANGTAVATLTFSISHGNLASVAISPNGQTLLSSDPTSRTYVAYLRDSDGNLITSSSMVSFIENSAGASVTLANTNTSITTTGTTSIIVTSVQNAVGNVIITAVATANSVTASGTASISVQSFGFNLAGNPNLIVNESLVIGFANFTQFSADTVFTLVGMGSINNSAGTITYSSGTTAGTATLTAVRTGFGTATIDMTVYPALTIAMRADEFGNITYPSPIGFENGDRMAPIIAGGGVVHNSGNVPTNVTLTSTNASVISVNNTFFATAASLGTAQFVVTTNNSFADGNIRSATTNVITIIDQLLVNGSHNDTNVATPTIYVDVGSNYTLTGITGGSAGTGNQATVTYNFADNSGAISANSSVISLTDNSRIITGSNAGSVTVYVRDVNFPNNIIAPTTNGTVRDIGITKRLTIIVSAPLAFVNSNGGALTLPTTLTSGNSTSFNIAGGGGDGSANITVSVNEGVGNLTPVNGVYTFTAPTTGDFADDYVITITDNESGFATTQTISVPLEVRISQPNLLGGNTGTRSQAVVTVRGAGNGESISLISSSSTLVSVGSSSSATDDANNANPAMFTITAQANPSVSTDFTIYAVTTSRPTGTISARVLSAITYSGTVSSSDNATTITNLGVRVVNNDRAVTITNTSFSVTLSRLVSGFHTLAFSANNHVSQEVLGTGNAQATITLATGGQTLLGTLTLSATRTGAVTTALIAVSGSQREELSVVIPAGASTVSYQFNLRAQIYTVSAQANSYFNAVARNVDLSTTSQTQNLSLVSKPSIAYRVATSDATLVFSAVDVNNNNAVSNINNNHEVRLDSISSIDITSGSGNVRTVPFSAGIGFINTQSATLLLTNNGTVVFTYHYIGIDIITDNTTGATSTITRIADEKLGGSEVVASSDDADNVNAGFELVFDQQASGATFTGRDTNADINQMTLELPADGLDLTGLGVATNNIREIQVSLTPVNVDPARAVAQGSENTFFRIDIAVVRTDNNVVVSANKELSQPLRVTMKYDPSLVTAEQFISGEYIVRHAEDITSLELGDRIEDITIAANDIDTENNTISFNLTTLSGVAITLGSGSSGGSILVGVNNGIGGGGCSLNSSQNQGVDPMFYILLMLAILGLLRTKIIKLLLVMGVLIAPNLQANGAYFGAEVGMSRLEPVIVSGDFTRDQTNDTAFKFYVGQYVYDQFALELTYAKLGEATVRNNTTNISIDYQQISFGGIYHLADLGTWQPFIGVGIRYNDIDISSNNTTTITDSSGTNNYYTVGAYIPLEDQDLSVRLSHTEYSDDLALSSIGFIVPFEF